MSRQPPPRPEPDGVPHEGDAGALLDLLRGELDAEARKALEARLASEPGLAQTRDRLAAFLQAVGTAHRVAAEPGQAARVVARIRARDQAARRAAARPARRVRLTWPRLIAASLALHVLLLAVVTWKARDRALADDLSQLRASLGARSLDAGEAGVPAGPGLPAALPDARAPRQRIAELLPEGQPWPEETPLEPLEEQMREFAPGSGHHMLLRTETALKRSRLAGLGFDPDGTLRAVRRGLDALARRQRADGSFVARGGDQALATTALALLPFLGEGHGSATGARGPEVVGPGIAYLRRALFAADGQAGERARALAADEAGMVLKCLGEDYVLSYGRLTPSAAQLRASELRSLTALILAGQAEDGAFAGLDGDARRTIWALWGLDAAQRTGVVRLPESASARFVRWYRDGETGTDGFRLAAGVLVARDLGPAFDTERRDAVSAILTRETGRAGDPLLVATAGAGLLLADPATFRTFSAGLGERLQGLLLPTGIVREGDPVRDTALVLLALQVAYRTF